MFVVEFFVPHYKILSKKSILPIPSKGSFLKITKKLFVLVERAEPMYRIKSIKEMFQKKEYISPFLS